jgi:hypothetical protein
MSEDGYPSNRSDNQQKLFERRNRCRSWELDGKRIQQKKIDPLVHGDTTRPRTARLRSEAVGTPKRKRKRRGIQPHGLRRRIGRKQITKTAARLGRRHSKSRLRKRDGDTQRKWRRAAREVGPK